MNNVPALCRGSRALLQDWLECNPARSLSFCIPAIILGCGAYGFAMGMWQGWTMATYVAIKFPLVILATLLVNGMINGMLAWHWEVASVLGKAFSFSWLASLSCPLSCSLSARWHYLLSFMLQTQQRLVQTNSIASSCSPTP